MVGWDRARGVDPTSTSERTGRITDYAGSVRLRPGLTRGLRHTAHNDANRIGSIPFSKFQ